MYNVGALWLAVDALWLATLMCWAAGLWWVFELTTHFRQQYLLAAVLITVWALAAGHWVVAVLAVLAALPHLLQVMRTARPSGLPPAGADGTALRLATFNLAYPNHNAETVDRYIADLKPDILLLQEADLNWPGPLSGTILPYACKAVKTTGDHLFLLSRFPILSWRKVRSQEISTPMLLSELEIDGRIVTVVNLHAASPKTRLKARLRNRQLEDLARLLATIEGPIIVGGDFNCSPWSPYFAVLMNGLGLTNIIQGRAWNWSWPAALSVFGTPIDHILINRSFRLRALSRGPQLGSDHLPLIAELELAPLS